MIRCLGFLLLLATGAAQPADLLLLGRIQTGNAAAPTAEAVAIRDGRIAWVGDAAGVQSFRGPATRTLDLAGYHVYPGFTDAHVHLAGIGFRELSFNLEGVTGIADLRSRLRARAADTPPGRWITGRGWIETHWSPSVFPTAKDLDAAAPDHPVSLTRADGHALVANSLALKLAGIDQTTEDPTGGKILRDSAGNATGMLIDTAMTLVRRLIPRPTDAETEQALIVGAQREASLGWTGVHIAGQSYEESELLRKLVAEGKVSIRIYSAVTTGASADRLLQEGPIIGESDGRFTRRAVKFVADGALGSRGAALLEPYADAPDTSGLVIIKPAQAREYFRKALEHGIQVETHAIGDRGNRMALDLYEEAFGTVPTAQRAIADPRWRIEHAQVLAPQDIPRFAQLGVLASMQPSHAIGDLYFAPARLGKERLAGTYAWRSLIDSGARLAGGSDAPVERGEPLIEFYAAVARRGLDGFANDDWHREQRLSRSEALHFLAGGPAFAAFEERDRGTIEVGKRADFTVLSADIMTVPEPEILKTRCVLTLIGGEIVHDAR